MPLIIYFHLEINYYLEEKYFDYVNSGYRVSSNLGKIVIS